VIETLKAAFVRGRLDRDEFELRVGAGGQARQRLPSAGPGRQPPPADPSRQHAAEAAPGRLPRPALPGSRSLRLAGAE
jgi:hypothetical protein